MISKQGKFTVHGKHNCVRKQKGLKRDREHIVNFCFCASISFHYITQSTPRFVGFACKNIEKDYLQMK